jgi:hypothetical protein
MYSPLLLQSAAQRVCVINREQDLPGIRVGLHDEIFLVLAGVDAASTSCYLPTVADHRDADTWGVHPLDASKQGLKPDYTIADIRLLLCLIGSSIVAVSPSNIVPTTWFRPAALAK